MPLTEPYVRTQVAGQAEGTVDGKPRDLACFLRFAVKVSGQDDRRKWFQSRTEAFLKALALGHVLRPSTHGDAMPQRWFQSTIARTYATVRQRSPRGSRHVHQNRPLDHLYRVAREPAIRLIHRVARGDVIPPAVGGTPDNDASELARP
jgi:hypothetical protein